MTDSSLNPTASHVGVGAVVAYRLQRELHEVLRATVLKRIYERQQDYMVFVGWSTLHHLNRYVTSVLAPAIAWKLPVENHDEPFGMFWGFPLCVDDGIPEGEFVIAHARIST